MSDRDAAGGPDHRSGQGEQPPATTGEARFGKRPGRAGPGSAGPPGERDQRSQAPRRESKEGSAAPRKPEAGSAASRESEAGSAASPAEPQALAAGSGWGTARGWDVPWIEPLAADDEPAGRAELLAAFGEAIRKTGSLMNLMTLAAAERIGINGTDLNCLNILSFSGHLTAGELARATGLTTASITGVVDRLEEAGFVTRERDPHDRRRVVVRIVLERALRDVAAVFLPMVQAWQQMAARYSDDELRLIVGFYGRMEQVIREHLVRLRDRGVPDSAGRRPPPTG